MNKPNQKQESKKNEPNQKPVKLNQGKQKTAKGGARELNIGRLS